MNINDLPDVSPDELDDAADDLFESVHLSAPTNWRDNKKLDKENSAFNPDNGPSQVVASALKKK